MTAVIYGQRSAVVVWGACVPRRETSAMRLAVKDGRERLIQWSDRRSALTMFWAYVGRRQSGMDHIGNPTLDDAVHVGLLDIAHAVVCCTTRALVVRGSADVCVALHKCQRSESSAVAWRLQNTGNSVTTMTTSLGLPVPVPDPRESWRIWRVKQAKSCAV